MVKFNIDEHLKITWQDVAKQQINLKIGSLEKYVRNLKFSFTEHQEQSAASPIYCCQLHFTDNLGIATHVVSTHRSGEIAIADALSRMHRTIKRSRQGLSNRQLKRSKSDFERFG